MKMKNRFRIAHIATGICILIAILLFIIIAVMFWDFDWGTNVYGGTKLEFSASSNNKGFNRESTLYLDEPISTVVFSGRITVHGTAEINVISNDTSATVFRQSYTDVNSKKVTFHLDNLAANSYYTLRFSSNNATKGYLLLTTDQALVERLPEVPKPSARLKHYINNGLILFS